MEGQDDRQVGPQLLEGVENPSERSPVVHVRGSMKGRHRVPVAVLARRRQPQLLQHARSPGPLAATKQRVDHCVAHQEDTVTGDPFPGQVLHAGLLGAEEKVADGVGEDAIDLLGHRPISAPQPRLDVRQRDPALCGHQSAGDRAVHVPEHQDDVGPELQRRRFEGLHDLGGLRGVAPRAHSQVHGGPGQLQVPKEAGAHGLVVVLSRMDQHGIDPLAAPVRGHQRRGLHEVGPRPHDAEDPKAAAGGLKRSRPSALWVAHDPSGIRRPFPKLRIAAKHTR